MTPHTPQPLLHRQTPRPAGLVWPKPHRARPRLLTSLSSCRTKNMECHRKYSRGNVGSLMPTRHLLCASEAKSHHKSYGRYCTPTLVCRVPFLCRICIHRASPAKLRKPSPLLHVCSRYKVVSFEMVTLCKRHFKFRRQTWKHRHNLKFKGMWHDRKLLNSC